MAKSNTYTHSGVFESQHQIPESFVSLNCSPESPVPMRGLSSLHSPLYAAAQLVNVDPLKSVLLSQNLPPLPKFSGELSDGFGMDAFQDWLEQFELIANVLVGPFRLSWSICIATCICQSH